MSDRVETATEPNRPRDKSGGGEAGPPTLAYRRVRADESPADRHEHEGVWALIGVGGAAAVTLAWCVVGTRVAQWWTGLPVLTFWATGTRAFDTVLVEVPLIAFSVLMAATASVALAAGLVRRWRPIASAVVIAAAVFAWFTTAIAAATSLESAFP